METEPDSGRAHYFLGDVYYYLGKNQGALDSFNVAFELLKEDDDLAGNIYYDRAMAYYELSEQALAEADLETAPSMATNLEFIDQVDVMLARPGAQMVSIAVRPVIEDPDMVYTISFDEKWDQYPTEPSEGYVLSLGFGEDDLLASADVYTVEWDPSFSLYEMAEILDPASEGATTQPLETIELGSESGLLKAYEIEELGETLIGRHYMGAKGDWAIVIMLWAVEEYYAEFKEEFEAMAASFNFLP